MMKTVKRWQQDGELTARQRRPGSAGSLAIALALCAGLLVAGSGEAQGTVLRVRKDGTGNYTTIQAAVNAMAARDTCLVGPGVYQERVNFPAGKSGQAGSLTTVKAETTGSVDTWGFDTLNCNYLRIEGFNIAPTNTGIPGILLRSSNLEVVSNYVHDLSSAGLQGYGDYINNHLIGNRIYNVGYGIIMSGTNWLVEANEIERLQYYASLGDADYVTFFGVNHVIRSNYFHGTLESEIGLAHVDGFQSWDNNGEYIQHIRIEGNRMTGFYHQGFIAAAAYHSNSFDIVICNNIFIGAKSWGVDAFNGLRDVKVHNNLFKDIYSFGVGINQGATGEVRNNIFYNVTAWDSATSPAIGSKNIWYRPGVTLGSRFNGDLLNVDPRFVDVSNSDFHLRADSPAIDAGVALAAVTFDRDGVARPQGAGWDIGPYEYNSTAYLLAPKLQNGSLSFTLSGDIGRSYSIEASTDLQHWSEVGTVTLTNSTALVNEPASGSNQFYRALLLP